MTTEYLLYEIREKMGKLNGDKIWTLGFADINTGEEYACVIDSTYRNYTRDGWSEYLHSPEPYGIYTGLKRAPSANSKRGEQILHGDAPSLTQTMSLSAEDAAKAIHMVRHHHKPRLPPPGPEGLFGWKDE